MKEQVDKPVPSRREATRDPGFERRINHMKMILNWPEKQLYSLGILSPKSLCLPDFIIIGAQKAGTTWLKKNIEHHPEIFMPVRMDISDPTEMRYFDKYFHESLRFYSSFFRPGMDKMKGEKSPNYCTLPLDRIRFIRAIMPDVRLILMMRNPIERAWSHAVMNLVKLSRRNIKDVSEAHFQRHFMRSRFRGDYPTIISNWLSVFPPEQLYVGFFEDITQSPTQLLTEVFAYLGVSTQVDWDSFPYRQVINRGSTVAIPEVHKSFLRVMYAREIEALYQRFGSRVAAWRTL